MAYGTNKKKPAAKKAAPAPKKAAPAPKKPAPTPKKSIMQRYKELSPIEKITQAPGFAFSAGLKKTIEAGEYGAKKFNEIKGDYQRGKKMREREEFKARGGKSIKQRIEESVNTYNKMQSSKNKKSK